MAYDTYAGIWGKVLLRCPLAGPSLAQDWVKNAFRRLTERRTVGWSWTRKSGQFLFNALYNTGTVDATFNNSTITGHGTAFTSAMVGRQFRVSTQTPIYTILSVNVGAQTLQLTLDGTSAAVWGGNTVTLSGYQIFNAYQTAPADFKRLITVYDPLRNWRLRLNVQAAEINAIDPQRSAQGPSYAVVDLGYDNSTSPPTARYEFWPYQMAQYVYPFLYISRPPDLDDSGATLPREIRGDVLLDMALAEAAKWPGPSQDKPNPYFDLHLALLHDQRAEQMIGELEVRDDEIYEEDVTMQTLQGLPFAVIPMLDSSWMQEHSI